MTNDKLVVTKENAQAMLEESSKMKSRARELKKVSAELLAESRRLRNEALATICPFNIDDMISFTTMTGMGARRKRVTRHMVVKNIMGHWSGGVEITGYQVNKKGERGSWRGCVATFRFDTEDSNGDIFGEVITI